MYVLLSGLLFVHVSNISCISIYLEVVVMKFQGLPVAGYIYYFHFDFQYVTLDLYLYIYRISRNIGGDLNLVIWWSRT